jgi:hypothetical protein
MVAVALIAVGLCAVAFAAGEQSEEDSVTNLLMSTKFKASTPQQLAMLNKLNKMNPKQQMLYDEGMEDEAHKQMNIAYQTFMKGKDEGVLAEYDALNATVTEEQDALVDYADEMGVCVSVFLIIPVLLLISTAAHFVSVLIHPRSLQTCGHWLHQKEICMVLNEHILTR